MNISRREFWGRSAAGVYGAIGLARELSGNPLGLPIGCQVYPVRESLGKDLDGTLRQLAAAGFQTIEMCSPPSYGSTFRPLVGLKGTELRDKIHAAGLRCESCHYGFKELKESLDDRIAYAKDLGLKQMVLSSFALKPDATLDDWTRAASDMNSIADRIHRAGFDVGYHNHNFEFKQLDGVLVYDKLMSTFDPKLVKMQFQVSVISLGYEAATYMRKYPGRFLSLHLQDWSSTEKKPVAIGQGVVDWNKLFTAAKTGGVKNYFVEMNMDLMAASVPYLHKL